MRTRTAARWALGLILGLAGALLAPGGGPAPPTAAARFTKAAATAKLLVDPARAGDEISPASATTIAEALTAGKLARAVAADRGPALDIPRDINEQKVLRAMAHVFSKHVAQNPPDAPDFRAVNPKTREDCDKLVARRLAALLK